MVPTPLPLESGGAISQFIPDGAGMDNQMGTISLGALIQYINQRTYSDLLNLAEILPRKSDLEKKIHIVQFAQKTRQMYVRLLALVKWAASASKVDKCCHITAFLEKQNSLIINTADKLFQMTKENLVSARLPHFHIPAAVETLTTGSYTRLPLAIRQRILPPDPITSSEKKQTLAKIEQIIQHRLVMSDLPKQMRTSNIENGRVKFTVDHEFEVSLTLMSDSISEPWRLLEVDILVEDKETGEGKELVHPMQITYLYQLVQSRLHDNASPLIELYTIFHSFCQSLQLEILYAQTLKLLEDRLDTHIRIEEYLQGKSLTLTYWRALTQKNGNNTTGAQLGYRFTVQIDPTRGTSPLMLLHTPVLGLQESEVTERAIRSDQLSIERLLVHTIYMRTKSRLSELKSEFDDKFGSTGEKCLLNGSPAVLHVAVVQPCFKSEQLLITVDTHTGVLIPHIPQYENFPRMKELKACLNHDKSKFDDVMADLRFFIIVRRTEKTLQHLEAAAHERLPLMYDSSHPLHSLSKNKIYITFHRHPTYILIVEVVPNAERIFEMETNTFLLSVKEASIEDNPKDDSVQSTIPKSYLRAYKLMSLDSFLCTHGPTTSVDNSMTADGPIGGKRRVLPETDMPNKRRKAPSYFLRDVAQIVALCDQIFPLAQIGHELEAIGVQTSGIQVEEGGMDVALRLTDLPSDSEISSDTLQILQKHIISITIRTSVMMKFNVPQQCKNSKSLIVEYIFAHCPIRSMTQKEQMNRRLVTFAYEAPSSDIIDHIVQSVIDDWVSVCKLYEIVQTFSVFYNSINDPSRNANIPVLNKICNSSNLKILGDIVKVRSFNYKSITLMYGPNFSAYVNIKYSAEKKRFLLHFGLSGSSQHSMNVHVEMVENFEDLVSRKGVYGLISLMLHLCNSYQPLLDIMNLRKTHVPSIFEKKYSTQWPVSLRMFHIIARSASCVHVIYRRVYYLQIEFLNNGLVSIRDGAFSKFQTSRAVEDFTPIKGLKAFLSKFVDENAISRRRSQSEDDNPPTPIPLDDSPWPAPPKPSSPARHGPITPPVSSNPHTPASPHPAAVVGASMGGFNPSPASGFPLSSPPSMGASMNPSPAGHISHPSPGGLLSHPSPSGLIATNSPSTQTLGVASPGFPTPSPLARSLSSHSPAGPYLTAASVTSQVSRILPNRPYAAAIPTVLTLDAFHTICAFTTVEMRQTGFNCTALEHFFGSTYLNKYLQQYIRTYDSSAQIKDHTNYQLKMESVIASFHLETTPLYSLRVKLQPTPDYADKWTPEELQALELLFSKKGACEPYRIQPLEAFMTMLRLPFVLLRDCARIIHLEMFGLGLQPSQQQLKWNVHWCMTVPIHSKAIMPPSQAAVYISTRKILFHMYISRVPTAGHSDVDPAVIVMPIVYDDTNKKVSVARKNDSGTIADRMDRIYQMISEMMARVQMPGVEPSMYNCVREILLNFSLGNDGPQQPTATSSAVLTNTTMTTGQQQHYQQPNSHIQQATNMGMPHSQGMGAMQGQMANMAAISHSNMPPGAMMQQSAPIARGNMQNMVPMQPNQPGFGNNMPMGQFQRQI